MVIPALLEAGEIVSPAEFLAELVRSAPIGIGGGPNRTIVFVYFLAISSINLAFS